MTDDTEDERESLVERMLTTAAQGTESEEVRVAGRPQPVRRQRAPSSPHEPQQEMTAAAKHRQTAVVMQLQRAETTKETCRLHYRAYLPMIGKCSSDQTHTCPLKSHQLIAVSYDEALPVDGHCSDGRMPPASRGMLSAAHRAAPISADNH